MPPNPNEPVAAAAAANQGASAPAPAGPQVTFEEYYASAAGGRVLYSGTVGEVAIAGAGGLIAALINPANSGRDLLIATIEVGALHAGRWARHRNPPGFALVGTPAGRPLTNRGGGPAASKARLLVPGEFTVTLTDASLAIPHYTAASTPLPRDLSGGLVLRPGDVFVWHFKPNTNQATAGTVNVVFAEKPAAP